MLMDVVALFVGFGLMLYIIDRISHPEG